MNDQTHGFFAIPDDVLHLGPPFSASAGETHHITSLYPPPPRTWQGMIRTRLLEAAGIDLADHSAANRRLIADLIGPPERLPAGWSIDGPWPAAYDGERLTAWFPTPQWIHRDADQANGNWFALAPLDPRASADLRCDIERPPLPLRGPDVARSEPVGGYIDAERLYTILSGGCPQPSQQEEPAFGIADWEIRPGLAMDENRQAKDRLLYFLRTVRHQSGAGLAAWLSAPLPERIPDDALTRGVLRAGRKARGLSLHPLPPLSDGWARLRSGEHLPKSLKDGDALWLYLASPVMLERNADGTLDLRLPSHGDVRFEVSTSLLGRPLTLGGITRHSGNGTVSLANQPHVPAGSCWRITVHGGTDSERALAVRDLHNSCALADHSALRAFGFGRVFVGLTSKPGVSP